MEKKLIDYEGFEAYSRGVRDKYAEKKDIPTSLSNLQEDSTHRTVQDTEKTKWNKITDKVDKVNGKQLSSNDYTDEDKKKVEAIPDNPKYTDTIPDLSGYATKTDLSGKIDKSQVTDDYYGKSSDMIVSQKGIKAMRLELRKDYNNKASKSELPTKLSQLENDKTFKTESEIQQMIEKASSLKKEVVTSLPTTGKDDVIYLVKDDKGKDNNNYLEYLWLNGKYELIGSTQVDLSGYATTESVSKLETAYNRDIKLVSGYIDQEAKNVRDMLKKKQDTIQWGNGIYKDPYGKICASQYNDASIQDELGKLMAYKLNKDDIQEFTQQELEEAFK